MASPQLCFAESGATVAEGRRRGAEVLGGKPGKAAGWVREAGCPPDPEHLAGCRELAQCLPESSPLWQERGIGTGGVEWQLGSTGKLTWPHWLHGFLFCSFTFKIVAHMLVAASLSPRSSLEEWELAGCIKVYRILNSTLEVVMERVAQANNQGYSR